MHIPDNRTEHHTEDYEHEELILRRGQQFKISITFNRGYNENQDSVVLQLATGKSDQTQLIVYRMGRLCGGAHEISGIKALLFLHGWVVGGFLRWVVVSGVGNWLGGWGGGVLSGVGLVVRVGVVGWLARCGGGGVGGLVAKPNIFSKNSILSSVFTKLSKNDTLA